MPSAPPSKTTAAAALLGLLLLAAAGPALAVGVAKAPLADGVAASIRGGRTLFLECRPPAGDAQAFFAPYLANPAGWTAFKNSGGTIALPYNKLNAETQRLLLLSVFPNDYIDEQGWWHTVTYAGDEGMESWWALAEWLTGRGTAYRELMAVPENARVSATLRRGDRIFVPRAMLLAPFREPGSRPVAPPPPPAPAPVETPAATPQAKGAMPAPAPTPKPEPGPISIARTTPVSPAPGRAAVTPNPSATPPLVPAATPPPAPEAPVQVAANAAGLPVFDSPRETAGDDRSALAPPLSSGDLRYGKDRRGEYAEYRLKRGEALYSAVVARFTDYREVPDILKAAEIIADRSDIKDVTNIDAGAPIRIPLDMISARFMPQGSAAREEFEDTLREARRLQSDRVRTRDLEGVVVIFDPGHGGRDHGAADPGTGVYEDEVAYDIMCRAMQILQAQTRARVYTTLVDPSQGYRPTDVTKFTHDTDEEVLVTPRYANYDARISANLRWYLANSIYRREIANGTDPRKIIFLSVHCDALYTHSLRGAMVYIPGAAWRRDTEQPMGAIYASYSEAKEELRVRTTDAERKRDEALSRNFAETFLNALQNNKPPIKVHDAGDPIRNVIRQSGGKAYVPAVLRNNLVPTKVLIEAVNLTNATDVERAADPKWRQWFAESLVQALGTHFGS